MNKVQLTKEGLEKLREELKNLKENKRQEVVDRLQKARGMGDLSENSEYTAAKESLALVEERIKEIEAIVKNAEIVENHSNNYQVALGSLVTIETDGQRQSFHIVGEFEADPLQQKLSSTSPIGKALLGKRSGETVEVEIPAGKTSYKILEIK